MNNVAVKGLTIPNEFAIGDHVYVKSDPQQNKGIITSITITPTGYYYSVTVVANVAQFYDFELSLEKDTAVVIE